ncbi:T9SS type A sorting domain-containing protein [candidate division WOR-3 bacterium]|nr:T9SS type A sorting domain-containing protein [candidate division WOR-3 bacterium]
MGGDSMYSYKLLLVSTDLGTTWSHTGNGLTGTVYCLAAAPSTPGLFFAGTSQGLFFSTDHGNNWTRTGTFTYVKAICVHPENESILYAGTNNGIYLTTNGGTVWQQINEGLLNLNVVALAFHTGENPTVFAGTSGAGIFATSPPTGLVQQHPAALNVLKLTPNPSRGFVRLIGLTRTDNEICCLIYDRTGRLLLSTTPQPEVDNNSWHIDLHHLPSGTYFLGIKDSHQTVFQPLIISK